MTVATTVGPVKIDTRDGLAAYRERNFLRSYDEALEALLEESSTELDELED